MKTFAKVICSLAVLTVGPVHAAEIARKGPLERVQAISGDGTGGCEVKMGGGQFFSGCVPSQWVSFNCNEATDKAEAYRMFDAAQMAYALGHEATITAETNTVTTDGYCIANKIVVVPPSP